MLFTFSKFVSGTEGRDIVLRWFGAKPVILLAVSNDSSSGHPSPRNFIGWLDA